MDSKFKDLLNNYFGSGWLFFLPYLILYLAFWSFNFPVKTLLRVFFILHTLHIFGLCYFIYLNCRFINFKDLLFWVALFSLFFNAGAYLEFPSDPWTHLFRIFQWENINQIHEADSNHKFAYFFGFSMLGHLDPINHKLGINGYHTFWAILTTIQFYKLAFITIKSKIWAKLATTCILLMLGNSSFSFFSYYGISSTMLAMIAFLGAINTLILLQNNKQKYGIFLIFSALILGASNHPQSLLLFLTSGTGILFHVIIAKNGWISFFKTVGIYLILSSFIFYLIIQMPICDDFRKLLNPYKLSSEWFYSWGGLKLFSFNPEINNSSGRFMQILGWYGILNSLASVYLVKKNHLIGWISLTPILLLLYPPFAQLLAYILIKFNTLIVFQRIILAIPISFSIIFVLKVFFKSKFWCYKYMLLLPIIFLTHLLVSINPYPNHFGRGFNILEKSHDDIFFERISETAEIIKNTIKTKPSILSDTATQTIINAQLGLCADSRLISESLSAKIRGLGGIEQIHSNLNFTHILTLSKQPNLSPRGSILGHASGHWDNQHLSNCLIFDPYLEKKLDKLIINGWKKEEISPWYIVYIRGNS